MKRILVIDPYSSEEHAATLQKVYGKEAVVSGHFRNLTKAQLLAGGPPLIENQREVEKNEAESQEKFDIFFMSAMMVESGQISAEKFLRDHGSESPKIVIMSSGGRKPMIPVSVPVLYLHKDKIQTAIGPISEETVTELRSFLN